MLRFPLTLSTAAPRRAIALRHSLRNPSCAVTARLSFSSAAKAQRENTSLYDKLLRDDVVEEPPHLSSSNKSASSSRASVPPVHMNIVRPRPLPELPPANKRVSIPGEDGRQRVPMLVNEDISNYVRPLYARGWGMTAQWVFGLERPGQKVVVLRKDFDLTTHAALFEFLGELGVTMARLKHHASLTTAYNKLQVVTFTHDAYDAVVPPGRRKPKPGYNSEGPPTKEGVTMRDVELAYEVERLYEKWIADTGRAYQYKFQERQLRPLTISTMFKKKNVDTDKPTIGDKSPRSEKKGARKDE